jgi:hypothetical protein
MYQAGVPEAEETKSAYTTEAQWDAEHAPAAAPAAAGEPRTTMYQAGVPEAEESKSAYTTEAQWDAEHAPAAAPAAPQVTSYESAEPESPSSYTTLEEAEAEFDEKKKRR